MAGVTTRRLAGHLERVLAEPGLTLTWGYRHMKPVIVTTSWDDGHKRDIRLASLLRKYGVGGTFYICPETHEFPAAERLTSDEIRELAGEFEIGAHTMTHPHLSRLDADAAREELLPYGSVGEHHDGTAPFRLWRTGGADRVSPPAWEVRRRPAGPRRSRAAT